MTELLKLRPHHILDILRTYGHGKDFTPHQYGHSLHKVAEKLFSDLTIKIQLTNKNDEICEPCIHLLPNGLCDDVLHQLKNPISKQQYNDSLDQKLFVYLNLEQNFILTFTEYLKLINNKVPGIEDICTHPKEDKKYRLDGLIKGLQKTGIKKE
jgi:hypothetical protein